MTAQAELVAEDDNAPEVMPFVARLKGLLSATPDTVEGLLDEYSQYANGMPF